MDIFNLATITSTTNTTYIIWPSSALSIVNFFVTSSTSSITNAGIVVDITNAVSRYVASKVNDCDY